MRCVRTRAGEQRRRRRVCPSGRGVFVFAISVAAVRAATAGRAIGTGAVIPGVPFAGVRGLGRAVLTAGWSGRLQELVDDVLNALQLQVRQDGTGTDAKEQNGTTVDAQDRDGSKGARPEGSGERGGRGGRGETHFRCAELLPPAPCTCGSAGLLKPGGAGMASARRRPNGEKRSFETPEPPAQLEGQPP